MPCTVGAWNIRAAPAPTPTPTRPPMMSDLINMIRNIQRILLVGWYPRAASHQGERHLLGIQAGDLDRDRQLDPEFTSWRGRKKNRNFSTGPTLRP